MKLAHRGFVALISICLSALMLISPSKATASQCTGNGPDLHGQTITDQKIDQLTNGQAFDGINTVPTVDFSNANLSGATFAVSQRLLFMGNYYCANLSGATNVPTRWGTNFDYANLTGTQIRLGRNNHLLNANLTDATLDLWVSYNADFSNSTLNRTSFDDSTNDGYLFIRGTFTNTDLRSIIVSPSKKLIFDGDFTGANLSGMRINQLGGNFLNANLSNSNIGTLGEGALNNSTNFTNANLESAKIRGYKPCVVPHSSNGLESYKDEYFKVTFDGAKINNLDLSDLGCYPGSGFLASNLPLANVESKQTTGNPILPRGYKIVNGNLFGPGVQISDADLGNSDLSSMDLTGVIGKGLRGTPTLPAEWKLISGNLIGPGATLLNQNFAGADLSKVNLRNVRSFGVSRVGKLPTGYKILSGIFFGPGVDLSGLTFNGVGSGGTQGCSHFSNLDLSAADLSYTGGGGSTCADGTYVDRLDFSNSNLTRVILKGSRLPSDTDFTGANLSYVDFTSSSIQGGEQLGYSHSLGRFNGANFTGANLAGFDLSVDYGTEKLTANFTLANLSGAALQNLNYSDSTFSKANLSNANLSNANLTNANLSNANLSNANLQGTNLDQVNLSGVKSGLIQGQPLNLDRSWTQMGGYLVGPSANLSHADLSNTTLSNLNLSGTRLNYADLSGSDLTNTNLSLANLNFANLISTNLQSANLAQAHMDYADLDSANLSGANLTSAILFGTNLTNAMFASTSVPSAFKSSSSGLGSGPSFANV